MANELVKERSRCDFDINELSVLLAGGHEIYEEHKKLFDDMGKYSETANHFGFYAMTPDEQQQDLWRRLKFMHQHPEL